MKAYSEDLRRKIVDAIERGMPKAQAARTFGVGISTFTSVTPPRPKGESLWSRARLRANRPRSTSGSRSYSWRTSKSGPFVSLKERCECMWRP
jgi:transposase